MDFIVEIGFFQIQKQSKRPQQVFSRMLKIAIQLKAERIKCRQFINLHIGRIVFADYLSVFHGLTGLPEFFQIAGAALFGVFFSEGSKPALSGQSRYFIFTFNVVRQCKKLLNRLIEAINQLLVDTVILHGNKTYFLIGFSQGLNKMCFTRRITGNKIGKIYRRYGIHVLVFCATKIRCWGEMCLVLRGRG